MGCRLGERKGGHAGGIREQRVHGAWRRPNLIGPCESGVLELFALQLGHNSGLFGLQKKVRKVGLNGSGP